MHDDGFIGQSRYLRWAPKLWLVLAVAVLLSGWSHSVQFATTFVLVAYVHGRWLPYTFLIADDGLALRFPFGRRLFLPKHSITIRLEMVGATVLTKSRRRWGYPLFDHVLYHPESMLAEAFVDRGYHVVEL